MQLLYIEPRDVIESTCKKDTRARASSIIGARFQCIAHRIRARLAWVQVNASLIGFESGRFGNFIFLENFLAKRHYRLSKKFRMT